MISVSMWNSDRPALLDDDCDHLVGVRWRVDNRSGYVIRYSERRIKLSHEVMGKPPTGFVWDHINRDKLDNQRQNLRLIPASGNAQNRSAHRNNVTGLRGVHLRKDTGRFLAHARTDGQIYRLGYYDTAEEAAAIARKFRLEHMPYTVEG